MVARFSKFYGKIWVGFCLNIEKRFFQLIHTNPGYLFQLKYFYGIFFFFWIETLTVTKNRSCHFKFAVTT